MEAYKIQKLHDLVKEGDFCDSEGQYDKAIAAYDCALQIDPDAADAWFNKGLTLKKMGKHHEGTRCIEAAINLYVGR
jgi:tetratricopeptide (TPR) repeat protein